MKYFSCPGDDGYLFYQRSALRNKHSPIHYCLQALIPGAFTRTDLIITRIPRAGISLCGRPAILHGCKMQKRKLCSRLLAGTEYSKELWAPEIHFLQGKWYIYFAADSGNNKDHRMYVLENDAADPLQGEFKFKGKLLTPEDKWSIDGSVFEHHSRLYFIWSGWEGDKNGQQNIYIAGMKDPWTIEGEESTIVKA